MLAEALAVRAMRAAEAPTVQTAIKHFFISVELAAMLTREVYETAAAAAEAADHSAKDKPAADPERTAARMAVTLI
jgi:hypothetical protein